jgi:hypothetical protein
MNNGKTYDLAILSHHKCATNWLRAICRELVKRKLALVDIAPDSTLGKAAVPSGGISIILDVNASYAPKSKVDPSKQPNVHFVRDPRDAFVSNYWSWLKSHENNNETILKFREKAANLSVEEGLLVLVNTFPMSAQLDTWPDLMWDQVHTVKYEALLDDFEGTLKVMMACGGLILSDQYASEIREITDFKKITGRNAGQEDVEHHFRKGVAGDWENYFTPRVRDAFFAKHGWLGERLGYW